MVRCKAHNLETEYACSGSIPEAATKWFFEVAWQYIRETYSKIYVTHWFIVGVSLVVMADSQQIMHRLHMVLCLLLFELPL